MALTQTHACLLLFQLLSFTLDHRHIGRTKVKQKLNLRGKRKSYKMYCLLKPVCSSKTGYKSLTHLHHNAVRPHPSHKAYLDSSDHPLITPSTLCLPSLICSIHLLPPNNPVLFVASSTVKFRSLKNKKQVKC